MARIIGVDLGSHSVKLAVMTGAFGRFEVEEYLAEELPEGEHDLPARLECLESMLASLPTDERITSAAAFPTEHSSVRLISLPFSDKKQIQQTLGFEGAHDDGDGLRRQARKPGNLGLGRRPAAPDERQDQPFVISPHPALV